MYASRQQLAAAEKVFTLTALSLALMIIAFVFISSPLLISFSLPYFLHPVTSIFATLCW